MNEYHDKKKLAGLLFDPRLLPLGLQICFLNENIFTAVTSQ